MTGAKPSYAYGACGIPPLAKTIGDLLDEVSTEFGENEAVVSVFEQRRLTYRQFRGEVDRLARALMALGVQAGDRVGIWSTNCVGWVLTQFATAKIGAILVNINPAYRLHELEYALAQSQCNYLLIGDGFKDIDYGQSVLTLVPELSAGDSEFHAKTRTTTRERGEPLSDRASCTGATFLSIHDPIILYASGGENFPPR